MAIWMLTTAIERYVDFARQAVNYVKATRDTTGSHWHSVFPKEPLFDSDNVSVWIGGENYSVKMGNVEVRFFTDLIALPYNNLDGAIEAFQPLYDKFKAAVAESFLTQEGVL